MALTITIQTTPRQDAKLNDLLVTMNNQRIAIGKPPYADVNEMSRAALIEQLKGWVAMAEAEETEAVKEGYDKADDSIRQQVRDLLGVYPTNPVEPPEPPEAP